ncbi:MAG: hypothetical protein R2713_01020 [Ilumatobacteraceae bacterium]
MAQPLSTAKKDGESRTPPLRSTRRPSPPRWSRRSSRRSSTSRSARSCRSRKGRTLRVPRRRQQGLRHHRRVRERQPGEIFLTVSAWFHAQRHHGRLREEHQLRPAVRSVPLRSFVEAFVNMRFEPIGMTDDPTSASPLSIMDYLFRRLALEYMSYDERAELSASSRSTSACSPRCPVWRSR